MFATVQRSFEVVIIGGGPAGSALAALLAKAGRRVALFERRAFPRFHVGESLIPAVNLTLERLGLLEAMDARGFVRKHGVQFFSPRGPSRPFYFAEVEDPRLHSTWQVLRSDFDQMLLEHAVAAGAQAFTQTPVFDVAMEDGAAKGVILGDDSVVRADVVVDASGQNGLLAQRFGGRDHIAGLENTSVFAHYKDVVLDPGIDAGSTLIYRLDGGAWLWLIPLPCVVSIGLVAHAQRIGAFGGSAAAMLDNAIERNPFLRERLVDAERTIDVRAVRDFSYRANRDGGPGWLRIGDALGFIDPIYSTGLFLSLFSAELAAAAIEREPRDFAGFAADYQRAFERFLVLVRAFYLDDFRFSEFAVDAERRQGLVDLLTGLVDTRSAIAVGEALRAAMAEEEERGIA
jgi:flavin-dependent dehydrogenase